MTHFTIKWNAKKAQKKLATAETALLPNEDIWFLGFCNNLKPFASEVALTSLRLVALQDREVKFEARYPDIASLTTDDKKETVKVTRRDGNSLVIKMVPKEDHGAILHYANYGHSTPTPSHVLETADAAAEEEAEIAHRATAVKAAYWPHTAVRGKLSRKASEAIHRQCHGKEQPWLILTSWGGAGTLVAFEDRMVIIKTGALTSFMAGTLGGERTATFHFAHITGIEYNSGFISGVLEILTPSYNGSANRDYWRGSTQSPNADSNNPWTLSNCLPLDKMEYREYLADINELKSRISKSKEVNVQVNVASPEAPPVTGLVDQLKDLAGLRDAGVLSEDEFAAAKARLITQ